MSPFQRQHEGAVRDDDIVVDTINCEMQIENRGAAQTVECEQLSPGNNYAGVTTIFCGKTLRNLEGERALPLFFELVF